MNALEWVCPPPGQREDWISLLLLADDSLAEVLSYRDQGHLTGLLGPDGPEGEILTVTRADGTAEILSLAVREDRQGRGLGRALVREALARLGAEGVSRVEVATATASLELLGFYQRLGFRMSRIERDVFTPERGYPEGLTENGVPVRDRVWLELLLDVSRGGVRLREIVDAAAEAGEFSGVVAIWQDNRPLMIGAWGLACRAWAIPNRLDTRFRVASIGKTFTALAVLRLVESGRLSLDQPVGALLDLEQISPEITVRQLLTMTAGIADWLEEEEDMDAAWDAIRSRVPVYCMRQNADYLPLFLDKPARFAPGERHAYSNASYILLGLLIERVTGQSYADHVTQEVLAPLGLSRTAFLSPEDIAAKVAEGYFQDQDGQWKRNIYQITPPAADGGLSSSAADLQAALRGIREGRLLSESGTQAILHTSVAEPGEAFRGYTFGYGYGLVFMRDAADEVLRYGHTGEEHGVSCRMWCYPKQGVDIVILGNQSGCAGELSWRLHEVIVGEGV